MRNIPVSFITENIKQMCMDANYFLSDDMVYKLTEVTETEVSLLGKQVLSQLQENLKIAKEEKRKKRKRRRKKIIEINSFSWRFLALSR